MDKYSTALTYLEKKWYRRRDNLAIVLLLMKHHSSKPKNLSSQNKNILIKRFASRVRIKIPGREVLNLMNYPFVTIANRVKLHIS
jgi:hypothetical protein